MPTTTEGYPALLRDIKARIQNVQVRATLSVNREMVLLYWGIGRDILKRQKEQGWGTGVVRHLAVDISGSFPGMKGFTPRNLLFMRSFAESWPDEAIVKQLVSLLPWGHNIRLIQTLKDRASRVWYARQCLKHGWSRNILALQIQGGLRKRQGKAVTNFRARLPRPQSDLAQQALKDPYVFDFLAMGKEILERDLESDLTGHITKFLLELGAGFAFVGRQVPLEVGGEDFHLDLLFYHTRLRCYVVIELKAGAFKPEYAGQLNFYLTAVDEKFKGPHDQPSIGLVLCREKNRLMAEYALRDIRKPMGVAKWQIRLVGALPKKLKASLPSVREIEKGMKG